MKELIIIISLAAILTVSILFAAGVFNSGKHTSNTNTAKANEIGTGLDDPVEVRKKYGIPPNDNYILPAEFKVGLVKQDKPHFMNNCNPDVLYPINGLSPDYGWKMPKDCRCTEFVQAP
jgi:hypothetical protein